VSCMTTCLTANQMLQIEAQPVPN